MFRDDHEAALARIAALEADLKRERSEDADRARKLARIEATLAKERAELARAEAELAKLRPAKPKPAPVRPAPVPAPAADVPAAPNAYLAPVVFFGVMFVMIVIALATRCGKRGSIDPEEPSRTWPRVPDEVDKLVAEATRRGGEALAGSKMLTLELTGVTEEGKLHPEYGSLQAYFQVEAAPAPRPEIDPSVPIGAAPPPERSPFANYRCTTLTYQKGEWSAESLGDGICITGELFKNQSALAPRCTTASIWARAIADGAPKGAIAEILLRPYGWRFSIRDQRVTFERNYEDDCR